MLIIEASSTSYCSTTLILTSPVSERNSRRREVTDCPCLVEEGDRIAQLVIERIETPSVVEVDVCVVQAHIHCLLTDIHLRTSKQPFVVLVDSVRQVGMGLFSPQLNACYPAIP